MKAGNNRFQWLVLVLVGTLLVPGSSVFALTSPVTCGNDSLLLLSPDALFIKHHEGGRTGLEISWADMNIEEATCFVLTGHEDLAYNLSVEGGFGDQVDRQLIFTGSADGAVGSVESTTLLINWVTEGSTTYGVLAGTINMANNGGVYRYSDSAVQWQQTNDGLPITWRQTNVVALGSGTNGFLVAAFSSGQTLGSKPEGIYVHGTLGWQPIAEDIFTDTVNITTISVSPLNNDHFAIGTDNDGLYITTDGGQTFVNWARNLDEDFEYNSERFMIAGLAWSQGRLWTFVPGFGLFVSENNGSSFERSILEVDVDLDDPAAGVALPINLFDIYVNTSDDDHVLVSLQDNGVYQTRDAGLTWTSTYGDLMVADPANAGAWKYSASSAVVDPADSDVLLVGMRGRGMYRSSDGGSTWGIVGEIAGPDTPSLYPNYSLVLSDGPGGEFYCSIDEWAVLVSADHGLTWDQLNPQPLLSRGGHLTLENDGSGDFYMSSWGGGMFVAGSTFSISDTYDSGTSPELRDLDLGIDMTIEAGDILSGTQFTLKCQTFQGWAIWRAPSHDPADMALIGVFDRVNPESCIEGYCGNNNWQIIPQCYNSKRAACFNFETPDTVRFFDSEIYNGFAYYYAVSSFDYGNTALSSPQNNSAVPIYSPRWTGDELSPYDGGGNRAFYRMDNPTTADAVGEEIYAYPNPLRLDSGLPGAEGETVVFTNLPEGSRLRIFTTAGDDVINLGPDNMLGGNIYWRSINRDNEPVSAGVYLYKIEMPSREDYWGKVVIIR